MPKPPAPVLSFKVAIDQLGAYAAAYSDRITSLLTDFTLQAGTGISDEALASMVEQALAEGGPLRGLLAREWDAYTRRAMQAIQTDAEYKTYIDSVRDTLRLGEQPELKFGEAFDVDDLAAMSDDELAASLRMQWVSIRDTRRCPSCEELHGEIHTWAEWQEIGPPGSPVLYCCARGVAYCRCTLVPITTAEKAGGIAPLSVPRKRVA